MDFSNEPFIKASGPLQYDSIESLHDSIHNTVGGVNYGHMQVIDVSAFDPVFWLHHAMVDRIFAMWQSIYPDTYMEPQVIADGALFSAIVMSDVGHTQYDG